VEITLTADKATFFSMSPIPKRLNPARRKKFPPYGLRKVEAIFNKKGFQVYISEPMSIKEGIIGLYVNDPFGMTEISRAIHEIFGEPPLQVTSFAELSAMISRRKDEGQNIRVVVGGPGAWEIAMRDAPWVNTVVLGEAETLSVCDILKGGKVVKTRRAKEEEFVSIIKPSSSPDVEISRTGRRIPLNVIEQEIKVQLRKHRDINLITDDILLWGEQLKPLLRLAKLGKKVTFSQISSERFSEDLVKTIKEELNLNENNWRSPVLASNGCVLQRVPDVIKILNYHFIYPIMFVKEEMAEEALQFKAIVVPIPSTENYFDVLYKVWLVEKRFLRIPFSSLIDVILQKAKETRGEYLRKLNIRGLGSLNLVTIILEGFINSIRLRTS